jgi:hypothetical protein
MFPFQDYKIFDIDSTNLNANVAVTTLSKRSLVSFEVDMSTVTINNGSSNIHFQHPIISTDLIYLYKESSDGALDLEFNFGTVTLEAGVTIYKYSQVHQLKGRLHILELPDAV